MLGLTGQFSIPLLYTSQNSDNVLITVTPADGFLLCFYKSLNIKTMKNFKKLSRAEMKRVEGGDGCPNCLSVNCVVGEPCSEPNSGTCTEFICEMRPGCITYFNKCV
jgi:hypothetical protein